MTWALESLLLNVETRAAIDLLTPGLVQPRLSCCSHLVGLTDKISCSFLLIMCVCMHIYLSNEEMKQVALGY